MKILLDGRGLKKSFALLVLALFVLLPMATAIEISDVRAEAITQTTASVKWQTDESADGFVSYGANRENLETVGDAKSSTAHDFLLSGLEQETTYYFKVSSGGTEDDNSGNLYEFKTSSPDTTPPDMEIEFPELVAGSRLELTGWTEVGVNVKVFVNGALVGSATARPVDQEDVQSGNRRGNKLSGIFNFERIPLEDDKENEIKVIATDQSENEIEKSGNVTADTSKPKLELEEVRSSLRENSFTLRGKISEDTSFEIFVNNRSTAKGEGREISQRISLEEGQNKIRVVVKDAAGWEVTQELELSADTQAPFIKAQIEKGSEYFEGRAESTISGETEPGAQVFLYVYRPRGYEFGPEFKKARARVVADSEGKFEFDDVDFASSISDISLDDLAPREVPSGLQEISIFPVQQVTEQRQFTYYIYIIAEDKAGRTGYWQSTVNVNSCFSKDFDFSVGVGEFQFPLRLSPALIEQGRQEIQTVFQLEYSGPGQPLRSSAGEIIEPGYRINNIRFEKACTPGMVEDDFVGMGCKLMPSNYNSIKNNDGSSVYVTWNLQSSEEFNERNEDLWEDLKKREIIFPVKIRLQYQDRISNEEWSEPKFQSSCYSLAYAVDVPANINEFVPDTMMEKGISALDFTIDKMQTVRPYVETGYYASAVTCMSSAGLRWIARGYRIFISKWEYFQTVLKTAKKEGRDEKDVEKEKGKCPADQSKLLMEDTRKAWVDAGINPSGYPIDWDDKDNTMEKRCPKTADAWDVEASLDQAYRWSCDRSACRAVPARWTEDKEEEEIERAIIQQNSCAVTGRGIPLEKVENCNKFVRANPLHLPAYFAGHEEKYSVCWKTADGTLYVRDEQKDRSHPEQSAKGIYHLTAVGNVFKDLGPVKDDLLVHQFKGSEGYFVGKDRTCEQVCADPRKPGYKAGEPACRDEKINDDGTLRIDIGTEIIDGRREFLAGYTSDCFIKDDVVGEPVFQQCVCKPKKITDKENLPARPAEIKEEWFYRQERLFKESYGKDGTNYLKIRYYEDRDQSGAFGADHLLDYLPGPKTIPEVNPYTQYVAPYQQVCLSGVLKHLKMWESLLVGMRNCLVQARTSDLQDSGMCKTILAQHACGLVYKGIAHIALGCNPVNFDDYKKEGEYEDIGFIISEGPDAFAGALQSSIQDLQDDYGNAVFTDYFRGGAQGFAQSLCMAAFGFDFPLFSKDFLLDAAYAFPMKSVPLIFPAFREMTSYNPARQRAIHNYEIGGTILPGCRIRRWNVKLKCIGPEDRGNPGIDETCNGEGCDCLNIQSQDNSFAGEREQLIKTGFNMGSGEVVDLEVESPLSVESHFRYDHVVVEMELDPTESSNADKCFDTEYVQGNKGVYYFPIRDVTPKNMFSCKASVVTGRYECPEISELFGFGGTYLQQPYVTCWNKVTNGWTDCNTGNLFLEGDVIKTRVHINSDGEGKCLKRTVRGEPTIEEEWWYEIPEGVKGPLFREDTLGTVQSSMFGAPDGRLQLIQESNYRCTQPALLGSPSGSITGGPFRFNYEPASPGKVRLKVPADVSIETPGYSRDPGQYLILGGDSEFTVANINQVEFNLNGFRIRNVLGDIDASSPERNVCAFRIVSSGRQISSVNHRDVYAKYELYEPAEGGCKFATIPVKASMGKSLHTQPIRVQQKRTEIEELESVHENFMSGNYGFVRTWAIRVISKLEGDLTNAIAIFYYTSSAIMEADGDKTKYKTLVSNLLDLFFARKWGEQKAAEWDTHLFATDEFKKIMKYMCEVDKVLDNTYAADCAAGRISIKS